MIRYKGAESKNPLAFHFYDPEKTVLGRKMKEHLPFAMSWRHTLGAAGTDMFGRDTAVKSFGAEKNTMTHANGKWRLMGCILSAASCRKWWLEDILGTGDYGADERAAAAGAARMEHKYRAFRKLYPALRNLY